MGQEKEDRTHNTDQSDQSQARKLGQASSRNVSPEPTSNAQGDINQQLSLMSPWKATLLLCFFWMIVWGIIVGSGLYAIGKLPPPVLAFATSIASAITVIGVLVVQYIEPATVRNFFRNVWERAHRAFSAVIGPFAAIGILVGSYIFSIAFLGPSSVLVPAPGPSITPLPTPTPTKWVSILKQPAPNCNNPLGVSWYVYLGGTHYICYSTGGVMQQTTSKVYAEMDLTKVKDASYNQNYFRMQTDIAFQNPGDTSTGAALLVQTPAAAGTPGGYIFAVSPDGHCELQYIETDQTIPVEAQASVNIDSHQLVQMIVIVQDDELYAYVNGQQVFSHTDNLGSSPSDVSLMVERQNAGPSSLIEFSNFELDIAS